jgi:hypothetical protein
LLGTVAFNKPREGVDSEKTLVSGTHCAVPLLLKMQQKCFHTFRCQVIDQEITWMLMRIFRAEVQQQGYRVAVTVLRMDREASFFHHVFQ